MGRVQPPSLKTQLQNCLDDLEATQSLLSKASSSITFFGFRIVTIQGYKGFCSLDTLMMNIVKVAREKRDLGDITLKERAFGTLIEDKLISLYKDSDAKLKECNFFTRLCCYVKDLFSTVSFGSCFSRIVPRDYIGYSLDIHMKDTLRGCFRGYSLEEHFIKDLGNEKDRLGLSIHSAGFEGSFTLARSKSIMGKARITHPELFDKLNLVNDL